MQTSKGDFILLDYKAKVKETGDIFDTSLADVAKEAKLFKENAIYEPMLVVVGEGWVIGALDENLVGLEVGSSKTVEISPEKAFGPRDPNKIKLVPIKKFSGSKIDPRPGVEVEVDGKIAIIRSVGAGRVQLDFNAPLAGRTLLYDVDVKQLLQDEETKIQSLIHRRIPTVPINKFEMSRAGDRITLMIPEEATYLEGVNAAKRGVALDIQKFFPSVNTVEFIERHVKKDTPESKPLEKSEDKSETPPATIESTVESATKTQ